ncbi:hypothetical protein NDU88_008419 [Pleurodeles waltl]|uniref:Uncharacterized protein n=1 Tax=Pleurodeles waltl TaxID=8319 RepID=A0AAV7QRQ1_PLEWA|nr:hypothetical protein NDU88_008419 [Pleurodeles waltl]
MYSLKQPGRPHNNWGKSRTLNNRSDHLSSGPSLERGTECVCGLGPVVRRAFLRLTLVCPEVLTPGGSLRDRVPPGRALLGRPSPRGSAEVRSRPGLLYAAGVWSCGLDAPGPGGLDWARGAAGGRLGVVPPSGAVGAARIIGAPPLGRFDPKNGRPAQYPWAGGARRAGVGRSHYTHKIHAKWMATQAG